MDLTSPPLQTNDHCFMIDMIDDPPRRTFPQGSTNTKLKSNVTLFLGTKLTNSISQPDGTLTNGHMCALSWKFLTIRPNASWSSSAIRSMAATSHIVHTETATIKRHFSDSPKLP
jgi:hypothetical protein